MNVNPINLSRIEIPSLHATRFPFNPANEKIMIPHRARREVSEESLGY